MKTIVTFLLALLISLSTNAQHKSEVNYGENPDDCKKNLQIMLIYYKQKAYEDAARSFRKAFVSCPESSKNIYIVGESIMKHYIKKNKENKDLKSKYVDSLLLIYNMRLKYFPGDQKSIMKILEGKGKALAQYRIKESMFEAYQLLDSVLDYTYPKTRSSTSTLFMYVSKIMNKKGTLSCSAVIENYIKVTNIVNENYDNKGYVKLKRKARSYANACLKCDLLDSLYTVDFEENKNDTNWLDDGIELLSEKSCNSSNVLVKMMEERLESAPVAKTAIILAQYYNNKQQKDKAKNYYDKAITLQNDSSEKANYLIKKAKFQNRIGNYSEARSSALKALNFDSKKAEAYIIIGNAIGYGAINCKDLKFGGAEVFWVAVDFYNRAASETKDPTIKSKALKKALKYATYFPREQDIFLATLNVGDSYNLGCWIDQTTTIRAKK